MRSFIIIIFEIEIESLKCFVLWFKIVSYDGETSQNSNQFLKLVEMLTYNNQIMYFLINLLLLRNNLFNSQFGVLFLQLYSFPGQGWFKYCLSFRPSI